MSTALGHRAGVVDQFLNFWAEIAESLGLDDPTGANLTFYKINIYLDHGTMCSIERENAGFGDEPEGLRQFADAFDGNMNDRLAMCDGLGAMGADESRTNWLLAPRPTMCPR